VERYKSRSQRARLATEAWAEGNLYCANCDSPRLGRSRANTPAIDFSCWTCRATFQLKAQSKPFGPRVVDAAFETMRRAIQLNQTLNLLMLHYDLERWRVCDLILVPHFAFSLSALEKREPLGSHARRAGWVGCYILLKNIPPDARIPVVSQGVASPAEVVRRQYASLRPLARLGHEQRGWTLDILSAIRSLGKSDFSLREAYAFEQQLARLHPSNRHVRDKIRQQLQTLRDMGLVEFLGRGNYRLR